MRQTWIVTADGAKARFFRYEGPNNPLYQFKCMDHVNKPSRELMDTKRGRVFKGDANSGGTRRAAMERPTDPHEHEKHVFAHEVADFLNQAIHDVDRLILIAAPKVLGDLRQCLNHEVQEKLTDELDKDLTNLPLDELPSHLDGVLNINPHQTHTPVDERHRRRISAGG